MSHAEAQLQGSLADASKLILDLGEDLWPSARSQPTLLFPRIQLEASFLQLESEESKVLDPRRGLGHWLRLGCEFESLRRVDRDRLGGSQDLVRGPLEIWVLGLNDDGLNICSPVTNYLVGPALPDSSFLH